MTTSTASAERTARKSPAWLARTTIYQLFLRPFTPEGTFNQAAKLLPHIADLGFECVYLCPFVEADDSSARRYWSERQKKSGLNNPRNPRKIFEEEGSAAMLRDFVRDIERPSFPKGARFIRMLNNHDWSHNDENPEKTIGPDGVDGILAVIFASEGIPFLYNGVEIADDHRHSIYSNRDFGGFAINWCNAVTPRGIKRREFLKQLLALRRSQPALTRGTTRWVDNNKLAEVIAFAREHRGQTVLLACNTRNRNVTVNVKETIYGEVKPLIERQASWIQAARTVTCKFEPYGFVLLKYKGSAK